MSVRRTIIVVAIAVVMCVVTWITESRGSTAAPGTVRPVAFTAAELPVDEMTRIELVIADRPALVYERGADGGWMQTQPFEHAMDPYSIRQIGVMAREVRVSDALAPADLDETLSLAGLGLDPPQAQLTLTSPTQSHTVQLGRRGVAGRAFMRRGEDVLVVSPQLHERVLEMDPREWRDRRLFNGAGIDAMTIELREGPNTIRLERDGRRWSMTVPVATRLDRAGRDELLQTLSIARSGGFIADQPADLASFGLAEPEGWVEVTSGSGGGERTERLLIGPRIGGSPDRFAMIEGRPSVFRIDGTTLGRIFRSTGLVDPTGSGVRPADIKAMTVHTDAGEFTIERDLERWIVPERGGREVPTDVANQLLSGLTEVRAASIELSPFPRDASIGHVILRNFDGRPIDTVRLARKPDGRLILESGDDVLRVFPASVQLPLAPAAFGLAD